MHACGPVADVSRLQESRQLTRQLLARLADSEAKDGEAAPVDVVQDALWQPARPAAASPSAMFHRAMKMCRKVSSLRAVRADRASRRSQELETDEGNTAPSDGRLLLQSQTPVLTVGHGARAGVLLALLTVSRCAQSALRDRSVRRSATIHSHGSFGGARAAPAWLRSVHPITARLRPCVQPPRRCLRTAL